MVARARLGIGIVFFSVVTFAVADFVSGRAANSPVHLVLLGQLAMLGAAFAALPRWAPSSVERITRLTVLGIYLTTAGAGIVTGDTLTTELLFLVMAMGTAALLPWAARSQLESVVFATVVAFAALAWTHERVSAAYAYPTLAMLVTFVASVFICREVSRYRIVLEDRNQALAKDVTERKRIEEELARARDMALESAATKSAFLANMSHEIRTPLNVIVGYNEIIRETLAERGDSELENCQERMQRACQRLLNTIHSILDFSRMEAGALELRREPLSVAALVGRIVEDCRPLANARSLALLLDVVEAKAVVYFDEYCLSGALLNLLQNAIKFTERGEILVKIFRNGNGELHVEVRDTGIGIDRGFLPNLFQPFNQEESGYRRRFEGSGLGLALTKRYLEINGARISVKSEKGQGSTFRVEFPRVCEQAPESRAEGGSPVMKGGTAK